MGRQFEVRKRAMFARYDRMAKAFTRCGREIMIAVRSGGPDPDANPSLRRAIQNARSVNMPKDRIDGAIKRAEGKDAENFAEVLYEAYGPGGTAIIVETATDNPTRTIADLRVIFKKNGGNIGASGSVAFQFNKMGVFRLDPAGLDLEELELNFIDYGLESVSESEDEDGNPIVEMYCSFNDFGNMQSALEDQKLETKSSGAEWLPTTPVKVDEATEEEVLKLVGLVEANDDVQHVFHNME